MAVYSFSALADGQAISFDPNADVLSFDQALITASDVNLISEGSNLRLRLINGPDQGKDILLLNTVVERLTTSNVTFANGSLLLVGDNTTAVNDTTPNTLAGTAGGDLLHGLSGNDTLTGNAGNDRIFGGEGNDSLAGGTGNDVLNGGNGADTLNGGDGDDTYAITAGDLIADSSGTDTIVTEATLTLAAGFENLLLLGTANVNGAGNAANNLVGGNAGNNNLQGGAGNDTVLGGAGNDSVYGNDGADWIGGTGGNDSLWGGGGQDLFLFEELGGAPDADLLMDFGSNWDGILSTATPTPRSVHRDGSSQATSASGQPPAPPPATTPTTASSTTAPRARSSTTPTAPAPARRCSSPRCKAAPRSSPPTSASIHRAAPRLRRRRQRRRPPASTAARAMTGSMERAAMTRSAGWAATTCFLASPAMTG